MFLLLTFQSDNMRHELPHCTEPLLNGTHIACVCVHSSRGRSSVFPFNLCVESALVGPHIACVCTCPQLHCGKGTEMGIREEREGIDVIGCLIMHSVTGGSSGGIRDQLSSLQAHFTQFSSTLGSDFNLWNDWFALVF